MEVSEKVTKVHVIYDLTVRQQTTSTPAAKKGERREKVCRSREVRAERRLVTKDVNLRGGLALNH